MLVLLLYVHSKQLRSCQDGQVTQQYYSWAGQLCHCWPSQGGTSVLSPLGCSFFHLFSWLASLLLCLLCLFVLYVTLALWLPASQFQLPALLFVCILFPLFLWFVVVLSDDPKQNQGRRLVDRKLVQAPPPR